MRVTDLPNKLWWLFLLTYTLQWWTYDGGNNLGEASGKTKFLFFSVSSEQHASTPPRGWNSYDSFSWIISEAEFLQNAQILSQKLHAQGYEYAVVDYLWYRRKVPGASADSLGFDVIDEWGRMIPDPDRWPSSRDGKGFTEVANKVHSMGLKFGIHVMRGISTQAVNANSPILDTTTGRAYEESGRVWKAQDIGLKEKACAWMQHGFMSVNTDLGAGKAFLRSLYQQYASWGVDFIKNDCVFGDDLNVNEITYISEVLKELDRPILYSLSPGTSVTPDMAKAVSGLSNMYRITGDDWDTWADVAAHFDVARDFAAAKMIGSGGLLGTSWPDLDMLPLGYLTDPGSNEGPHRTCRLTIQEQRTQVTLWSIAKSPLMFGGDLRNIDDTTFGLITNPTLLEINSYSSNNVEFPYIQGAGPGGRKHGLSRMYPTSVEESEVEVLGLTTCEDPKASRWLVEELDKDSERICWKGNMEGRHGEPFCLSKRNPLIEQDEETMYGSRYQGSLHLSASKDIELCLDASPKRKITSSEPARGSFSRCTLNANQMWEFHSNGTLISSYSGLCAKMKKVKANAGAAGARSWIASGRSGEIYLAFFNLNSYDMTISALVSDLGKALPGRTVSACTGKEIWSGTEISRPTLYSVSIRVEAHDCALYVLNCR
ncbi:alpha-galactosidase A-like [Rhodamnia argentea]|uniref:Alpha-galactosidase n=1 Tax=Rhodamnia argentea TaxID=178133 RepID=A0ABM3H8L2_9MYRT|nr:alpha-galactosidase A-like [Rhodamnia argentea]